MLTDISEDMLAVSRALNPECEHGIGDMRTLRLGRTFDAVFVHDAVCYLTTEADLRRAMETAWVHCRPGGAVLFAPDYVRENFRVGTSTGGCDERPSAGAAAGEYRRGLRYLEWVWDPDPRDTEYLVDYAFLLRERDGSVRAVEDRQRRGPVRSSLLVRSAGERRVRGPQRAAGAFRRGARGRHEIVRGATAALTESAPIPGLVPAARSL